MTKTTAILICCLLTLACTENNYYMPGDDGGSGPGGSTSATSAGGSDGGSGGSVGEGGQGGEATSAAGGAGGDGGGSEGGMGGQGGAEPMCPAPACASGPSTINCDPACGAVNPGCASCTNAAAAPTITIPHGTTELRIAPLAQPLPECDACTTNDPPWWNMMIKLPVDAGCIAVDGPDSLGISGTGALSGQAPIAAMCNGGNAEMGCISTNLGSLPGYEPWLILIIDEPAEVPDGGILITIATNASETCPQMGCMGGCNGD